MTAARRHWRIAVFVTRSAFGDDGWFAYSPGMAPTARSRWRGSRARRILTIPAQIRNAPAELGE